MKKLILILSILSSTLVFTNCSESEEPTPQKIEALLNFVLSDMQVGDEADLRASKNTPAPVKFTSSNTDVAIIEDGKVIALTVGDVTITASVEESSNYTSAEVSKTFSVMEADSEEPTEPGETVNPLDLSEIKAQIVGRKFETLRAEIGTTTITDMCQNTVEVDHWVIEFVDGSKIKLTDKCNGNVVANVYSYSLEHADNVLTLKVFATSSGKLIVNANFKNNDFVNTDGDMLNEVKGVFNATPETNNWTSSPIVTVGTI